MVVEEIQHGNRYLSTKIIKSYLLTCLFLRYFPFSKKLKTIGFGNCYISEITLAELKYGAECSSKVSENRELINDFDLLIASTAAFNQLVSC
jgi:predicted nucleic acid-binding protein